MHTAYLGLGSNMGDRQHQLQEAVKLLNEIDGIQVVQESPIYETKPVGYTDQPDFLNMCIEISIRIIRIIKSLYDDRTTTSSCSS